MPPSLHCCTILLASLLSAASSTTINYPSLYPKSFAWDHDHGRFIASSIIAGALFKFSGDGSQVQEFIKDVEYAGKAATLGLVVDQARKRVVVVVSNIFNSSSAFDALAAYDLETRERIFLARLHKDGMVGGANGVALDTSGNAYVTNSAANFVWKVTPKGEVSVFAESPLFTSQSMTIAESPAAKIGLNGVAVVRNTMLLVAETKSGKLFTVAFKDRIVQVVEMKQALIAPIELALRKDGALVVVSTDSVWLVTSNDGWFSARITDEVKLDRTLNATGLALRGDQTFVIHSHFHDLLTYFIDGSDMLPGGFRKEFSFQEIHFPTRSDNNPLWLLAIPGMFIFLYVTWQLQMSWFFEKYKRKRF